MSERPFLRRYKTNETAPEVLEAMLVQRHALADDLVLRVRASALTGNKHFVLIVGPRGIGKTHLVSLVVNRVLGRPEHADARERLRVAWLDENQTSTSLATLLNRVYTALAKEYPTEFTTDIRQTAGGRSPKEAAQVLAGHLLEQLGERTCLIVAENFDEIFQHMGLKGQQELRSFLQQHPRFAVLATSQQLFDGVSLRTSPFFGMFQVEHLQTLSLDDSVALFRRIAEHHHDADLLQFLGTKQGRDRVKALHFLAGGMPRLHVMLAEFMTKQTLDELVSLFEKLRDDLSNYYLERMRWLSPQQREIVQWLCQRESATPVKELAAALFMQHSDASSQLMRLRDLGYVESTPSGKESLYDLSEPLMRMSLNEEKRQSPDAPIPFIVEFLRIFYSREELEQFRETAKFPRSRGTLEAAFQLAKPKSGMRRNKDRVKPEKPSRKQQQAEKYFQQGNDAFDVGDFTTALAAYDKAIEFQPDDAIAWDNRGISLGCLGHYKEALEAHDKAIELHPGYPSGWNNRGVSLGQLCRYEEAFAAFNNAIELQPDFAKAWDNRGVSLERLGRYEESLAAHVKAIELQPDFAKAWHNCGVSLDRLGRYDEAIAAYDKAIELQPDFTKAWGDRGVSLGRLGHYEESLVTFDKAIEFQPDFANAWYNRGVSLERLGRYEESLVACDKAIEFQPDFASAWNNRAVSLLRLGRYEESLAAYDKAIELQPDFANARFNRVEPLMELGRWREGWQSLRETLQEFPPKNGDEAGDIPALVRIVLQSSLDAQLWKERMEELISIYAEADAEAFLGDGLVRSLKLIPTDRLSEKALDEWRQVWPEMVQKVAASTGRSLAGLQIPLRLFDVGMRYLATHNHRVLFDLPLEQRRLLKELLNIADESPAKPKPKKTPRRN